MSPAYKRAQSVATRIEKCHARDPWFAGTGLAPTPSGGWEVGVKTTPGVIVPPFRTTVNGVAVHVVPDTP